MKAPRRLFAVGLLAALPFMEKLQCDGGNSSPSCEGRIEDRRVTPNIGIAICTGASGWGQAEVVCEGVILGQRQLEIFTGPEKWHPGGGDLNGGFTAVSAQCGWLYPTIVDVWGISWG